MASPHIMKALIEKKLLIRKSPNVQGTVRLHFPNQEVQDIILTNSEPVDVFGRINISAEDIKRSNLESLVVAGDIQILQSK